MIKVRCKTCKHTFEVSKEDAITIRLKHDGFIPCEKCKSWATIWK